MGISGLHLHLVAGTVASPRSGVLGVSFTMGITLVLNVYVYASEHPSGLLPPKRLMRTENLNACNRK